MARPKDIPLMHQMEALGEEMLQWLSDHPEILHLSEWYTIEKMFTYNQWKTFIQYAEFVPYYQKALKIVGKQYLDKRSNVRESISQRWQRVYFPDLRESEDADMDADADRKARSLKNEATMQAEKNAEIMEAILNGKKPIQ